MSSNWITALKTYNSGKSGYIIPKKGSVEYDEVKKIMDTLPKIEKKEKVVKEKVVKEKVVKEKKPKFLKRVKPVQTVEPDSEPVQIVEPDSEPVIIIKKVKRTRKTKKVVEPEPEQCI